MVRIFYFFLFFFSVGKVVRYNTALARFRDNPDIHTKIKTKIQTQGNQISYKSPLQKNFNKKQIHYLENFNKKQNT